MTSDQPSWWDLHLRLARGELLAATDQERYDSEIARQDRADPLPNNLAVLRQQRSDLEALAQNNAALRTRIEQLEDEIRAVEQGLSRQARQLLGVRE